MGALLSSDDFGSSVEPTARLIRYDRKELVDR